MLKSIKNLASLQAISQGEESVRAERPAFTNFFAPLTHLDATSEQLGPDETDQQCPIGRDKYSEPSTHIRNHSFSTRPQYASHAGT